MATKQNVATIKQGELLPPDVTARCDERLRVARTHMAAGCYHWIEAGKQFEAIKAEVRGHWADWCREHDVSLTTADDLVRIAQRFSDALVTVTSREGLNIDFRALRLLAAPAIPEEVREQAVKKAETGDRITKAIAEKMVEDARRGEVERFAAIIEQRKRDASAEAEEAVAEAMRDLAGDKAALEARIAEIEAAAKKPDLKALERAIIAQPSFKGKKLTGDHWRLVAQLLDAPISAGNTTYAPVAKEEMLKNEENLRISGQVSQALETLAGAAPASAIFAAALPVQRWAHRRHISAVIEWCVSYRDLLEQDQ